MFGEIGCEHIWVEMEIMIAGEKMSTYMSCVSTRLKPLKGARRTKTVTESYRQFFVQNFCWKQFL